MVALLGEGLEDSLETRALIYLIRMTRRTSPQTQAKRHTAYPAAVLHIHIHLPSGESQKAALSCDMRHFRLDTQSLIWPYFRHKAASCYLLTLARPSAELFVVVATNGVVEFLRIVLVQRSGCARPLSVKSDIG